MSEEMIPIGFTEMVKEGLKNLNLFTIPQVIWIIELYYFMCNSFYIILDKLDILQALNITELPEEIFRVNSLIFEKMNYWIDGINLLLLVMFLTGITLSILNHIPIISNYMLIRVYSKYGLNISFWILLISLSYWLYNISGMYFPLIVILLFVLGVVLIELIKKTMEKLGLEISR